MAANRSSIVGPFFCSGPAGDDHPNGWAPVAVSVRNRARVRHRAKCCPAHLPPPPPPPPTDEMASLAVRVFQEAAEEAFHCLLLGLPLPNHCLPLTSHCRINALPRVVGECRWVAKSKENVVAEEKTRVRLEEIIQVIPAITREDCPYLHHGL